MSPGLLTILIFAAGALAVVAVYSLVTDLFLRDRSRVSQRVDEEFRQRQRNQIRKAGLFKGDLVAFATGAAEEDARLSARERFEAMVNQSGLNLEPQRLLMIMILAGLGCAAMAGLLRDSVLIAVIGSIIGAGIPYLYVSQKRKSRLQKMTRQLPDAFDLMARVIRAGQTMSQSIQAVADEFDQPLAGEFTYCAEQQNLGMSAESSFRDLSRRTGLLEIKIFVLALLVQQQSGGNLAEVLDNLAHVVRERFRVQGKIRVLTTEGRFQALILLIIPPAMMCLMSAANEQYAASLAKYPLIILAIAISELIGALWIRKIVNFDY